MYTDWLLIRRLAWELHRRFAGARVRDVGQLDDGRFAIALWSRGEQHLLCIDVFAPTPVVTVEDGDLPIAVEPGFVRTAGAALRAAALLAVRSRTGDRLLRLDFGTRSRFGVQDGYSLICELVPRFGNIVLLKGDTIVAAAKEFAPAENAVRSIQAGDTYEPPPLRPGDSTPFVPERDVDRLAEAIPQGQDLHVYRRNGALVQAHLVPLEKFSELQHGRAASLLALLEEARRTHEHAEQSDRIAKRRRSLERVLAERERKLRAEIAQTQAALRQSEKRETLRAAGEAIYATLHELPPAEQEDAKQRAAELFAKYKKAAASVEHLQRRNEELQHGLDDVLAMRWELERAGDAEIDDVADAVASLEPKQRARSRRTPRARKPLQYTTKHGSRIFVGRTPIENADLTFRVARPDDLWFHVQSQPGAHVILQRDDRSPAPQSDLVTAASLAALHSKAKNSPKVTVDYTQRKFVRKRPSAAPGLVFYTHPKSLYVEPREP